MVSFDVRIAILGVAALSLGLIMGCDGAPGAHDGGAADASSRQDAPQPDAGERHPVPQVVLTSDVVATRPGAAIPLSWLVTDPDATSLVLRAIAPGAPVETTGPRAWSPGVAPATGSVRWLSPAGSWEDAPVTYATSASSGARAIRLPGDDEGEWVLEALLERNGEPLDASEVRLLVASRPAMMLHINRLAAGPNDEVRVELLTAAGELPSAVQLLTWLVRPDGSETPLPEGTPQGPLLHEGLAMDARRLLLARDFAGEASGTYRVGARLTDQASGALLGLAEASFTVCAGTATLQGVARRSDGTPLAAAPGGSVVARVTAIDLDDGRGVTGPLASDGSYTLELGAGTYAVLAQRVDERGRHWAAAEPVTVGGACEPGLSVDLAATGAPEPVDGALARARPTTHASPLSSRTSSDGLPTPRVRVLYQGSLPGRVLTAEEELLADVFEAELAMYIERGDIDLTSQATARTLVALSQRQMQLGTQTGLVELSHIFADDFLIFVSFGRVGSRSRIQVQLVDSRTQFVRAGLESEGYSDVTVALGILRTLARTAATNFVGDARPLLQVLRDLQPCPLAPRLELAPLPDLPAGTARAVVVRATLSDLNGRLCALRPVRLSHRRVGASSYERQVIETNMDGVAEATFVSPGTPGVESYFGTFEAGQTPLELPPRAYRVLEPEGGVAVVPTRVVVRRGETLPVEVRVRGGDLAPLPSDGLAYGATLGALSAARGTTDSSGRAEVQLVVGASEPLRIGMISATRTAATEIVGRAAYLVTDAATLTLSAGSSALASGGATSLSGSVQLGEGGAPGVTVLLSVAGGGTVTPSRIVTGAAGEFRVDYRAPEGSGSAVVTATIVVDGQRTTRAVELSYEVLPPPTFPAGAGEWVGACEQYDLCGGAGLIRSAVDGVFFFGSSGGYLRCGGETHFLLGDPGSYSLAGATTIVVEDAGSFGHFLTITQAADGRLSGTFDFTVACVKGGPSARVTEWRMLDMARVR